MNFPKSLSDAAAKEQSYQSPAEMKSVDDPWQKRDPLNLSSHEVIRVEKHDGMDVSIAMIPVHNKD